MAQLGQWTGGAKAQGNLPETWTAPASLFDTQDRNDSSIYGWAAATSTLTLPSTNLADGYLIIAAFEYHDTSNGRFNPQVKIVQASGTGNFVGSPTGGYDRDTSEDRAYVRCWAIVDNPSASATFQVQWKGDTDDATGGTERSTLQVIPLYYSNIGMYTSASAALYGGTTPNQVTGFSVTHESDTAAIELASNVVTMKGDNKRYLCFGSQFFEGRGGRTQRWHGFRVDSSKVDYAKAYSYYRNTSNDESGDMFTHLINRVTTDITIDQFCYRGDGVAAGQGGADVDGSTPSVGDHATVVIELNDNAEVYAAHDDQASPNLATTAPVDVSPFENQDVADAGSWTKTSSTGVNANVAMDALCGANVSAAQNTVSSGSRWTAFAEFTIDGVEDTDTFAGDYLRGNQGSQDTFGWSANLLSFLALALNEDVGLSVSELSGSEGGGGNITSPANWTGMWMVNLDTLQAGGTTTESITKSLVYRVQRSISAITKSLQYTILDTRYSREDASTLPTNANDLATIYTSGEEGDVATDNNVYVDLTAADNGVHQFRKQNDNGNNTDDITVTVRVKTDLAPSTETVYLQIYNYNSSTWETLDSDNTTAVDTEFVLTGTQSDNVSNYYTTGNYVAVRVYQVNS
jgi:hypothetical protein